MVIENYYYLFGLFIIIPLILFLVFAFKKRRRMMKRFSTHPIFNVNIKHLFLMKNFRLISAIFTILVVSIMVFALSTPKWGVFYRGVLVETYDIVFVLDFSKSMNSEDVEPSRLERAKLEIIDFIRKADNIRVGLIAFAGSNFIASPLTFDMETFITILNSLSSSSMTVGGTHIIDALETAENIFIENSDADRSLILITDGEEQSTSQKNIADDFAKKGIKIYAIAIGSEQGSYIPDYDERGRSLGYKKDSQAKPIISKRNDALIKMIAEETGGEFYVSEDGDIDFEKIYQNIKQSSKIQSFESTRQDYKPRHHIFIFIAALLLLFEIVFEIFISYKSGNKSARKINDINETKN